MTKDIDSYWNDPLLSIMLKPSREASCSNKSVSSRFEGPSRTNSEDRSLLERLETLQLSIREVILQAPTREEQDLLVTLVTKWAGELASDPLGEPRLSRRASHESSSSLVEPETKKVGNDCSAKEEQSKRAAV